MKHKALSHYSFYSLKVVIGAVILLVVAVVSAPDMLIEKFRKLTGPGDQA